MSYFFPNSPISTAKNKALCGFLILLLLVWVPAMDAIIRLFIDQQEGMRITFAKCDEWRSDMQKEWIEAHRYFYPWSVSVRDQILCGTVCDFESGRVFFIVNDPLYSFELKRPR